MTEWQPIETAPKDGTPILLAVGKVVGSGAYRSRERFIATQKDFYFDGADLPSRAKHWMPLPPPPSVSA